MKTVRVSDLILVMPWQTPEPSAGNGQCVRWSVTEDGWFAISDDKDTRPDAPVLLFTPSEIKAFRDGVAAGNLDEALAKAEELFSKGAAVQADTSERELVPA